MGSLAFTRKKTSHRTAMVAPLHGALVLLAFVLHLHRNWYLVCCDELLGTCCHVWIFCNHSNEISQVCDSICDLHHACTVDADVGWHVCDVHKTNSVLGLGMYFSYFVLFFKLFVDNYCLN